jgi:hypothetical protein
MTIENLKTFNRDMTIFLLTLMVTFIMCQLDEKSMIENKQIHNIFLGKVHLKEIEIKD